MRRNTRQSRRNVVIIQELATPIRSDLPLNYCLLVVGVVMALHPIAWILLSHYRGNERDEMNTPWLVEALIDCLAYYVLDVTPMVAGDTLVLFLAVFFLFSGVTSLKTP